MIELQETIQVNIYYNFDRCLLHKDLGGRTMCFLNNLRG